jgi:hypothetical protein
VPRKQFNFSHYSGSGNSNDIADARLLTVSEEDMPPSPATPALLMTTAAPPQPSPPPPRPVVDLTEEKPSVGGEAGDDLQRAIELSLAEVMGDHRIIYVEKEICSVADPRNIYPESRNRIFSIPNPNFSIPKKPSEI